MFDVGRSIVVLNRSCFRTETVSARLRRFPVTCKRNAVAPETKVKVNPTDKTKRLKEGGYNTPLGFVTGATRSLQRTAWPNYLPRGTTCALRKYFVAPRHTLVARRSNPAILKLRGEGQSVQPTHKIVLVRCFRRHRCVTMVVENCKSITIQDRH
jgi:hypothetical protein